MLSQNEGNAVVSLCGLCFTVKVFHCLKNGIACLRFWTCLYKEQVFKTVACHFITCGKFFMLECIAELFCLMWVAMAGLVKISHWLIL